MFHEGQFMVQSMDRKRTIDRFELMHSLKQSDRPSSPRLLRKLASRGSVGSLSIGRRQPLTHGSRRTDGFEQGVVGPASS